MSELWRLLPVDRGKVDAQLALSEQLVRNGMAASIWWHAPSEPALVIGPSQRNFPGLVSGIPVVRRTSGGTAVYASTDLLGLDVFLPAGHHLSTPDVVDSYRWLGEVWRHALSSLGVRARLISIAEARASRELADRFGELSGALGDACFGSFSPYEVAHGTHKLVGLAQLRRRNGTLFHSALYHRFDAAALATLLALRRQRELARLLAQRAIGLDQVTSAHIDDENIRAAFAASLFSLQNVELIAADWSAIRGSTTS